MQTFKFSDASARRNAFMKDMRNVQREEIKKRARTEMVKHLSQQTLAELIDETKHHITTQALGQLVHYANLHFHKAVAHIGNLIIDGVADITQLERFTLVPDYHHNWLWLVEVLVQREYCTIGLFQHCIKTIAPNRHEKSVKHALSILYKITASNLHSSFLLREEKVLLSILNATSRSDSASKTAYMLILELISKQANLANRFQEGILRERLVQAIKRGFRSTEVIVIKNSCRILKELAEKDVFLNGQLERQIITFVHSPYFEMIGQTLLQYLLLFVHSQKEKVVELIDMGLLVELSSWKEKFESEERQETGQIIQLCREIKDHTSGMGLLTKGIHQELDRLDLLTYKCTISQISC